MEPHLSSNFSPFQYLGTDLVESSNTSKEEKVNSSKSNWNAKLNKVFDHFMTHPVMEAGKLVARFLPGVGIFMLGVD
ncbi:hypothetical protein HMI54_009694, partial [Coelomomyces lativittatus]